MKEEFIQAVGFDLQTAMKQTIELMGLVNTGYLKNYVYVSFNGNVINIHFPDYAQVLEFGCPAFDITPNSKKALFWKGAKHPVKKVRHPGIREYAFIRTTLHQKLNEIIKSNLHHLYK